LAIAIVVVFVLPTPVFRGLGILGYTSLVIPTVAMLIAAAFGAAQYVQLALEERRDNAEARRLRDRGRSRPRS
jgi:hypothetical protein